MGPGFDGLESDRDTITSNEPLIDIDTEPAPPSEPGPPPQPRRRRLSDVQGERAEATPPEPKPQRRCLSAAVQNAAEEPASEPRQTSGRPRLSITQPQEESCVAVAEMEAADVVSRVAEPRLDPAKVTQWLADDRSRQSLPLAAIGGLLAAAVGAMVWAVITVITQFQIGWMAVGVGFLVGGVVRALGRGLDKPFGYLGAGLALLSCLLGNYLTNCMFIAREAGLSVSSVMTHINMAAIPGLMIRTLHPLDLLFYGLAVYEGYRFSFRRITEADIGRIQQAV